MSFNTNTIRAVERILTNGESSADSLSAFEKARAVGLWWISSDGKTAVATGALIPLISGLPNETESLAAVFACEPELRQSWSQIAAARLKELGQQTEASGLIVAIDTLSAASGEVLENLENASLKPTAHGELERALFGATANQATSAPILFRVLGQTAPLLERAAVAKDFSLPMVNSRDPEPNWKPGRLLRLPEREEIAPAKFVLDGNLEKIESAKNGRIMEAVLESPWAFLLAQMVFTKEAWEAERITGGVSFELEELHISRSHQPPQVNVIVHRTDGAEIFCGSLGELVTRVLSRLGVNLLAVRNKPGELDNRLSEVIAVLLRRKVWQFQAGGGFRRAGYVIHPEFSDECYRALGSRYFYRLGRSVTGAIRQVCELWADERMFQAETKTKEAAVYSERVEAF